MRSNWSARPSRQIRSDELHARPSTPWRARIGSRDAPGPRRDVGGDDPAPGRSARQRDREAAAAGADVDDRRMRGRRRDRRASSTISSVSGRGIRTSGVTAKSRLQNSRMPDDVGHRLAARAPSIDERLDSARRTRRAAVCRGRVTAAARGPSRGRGGPAPRRRSRRLRRRCRRATSCASRGGDVLAQRHDTRRWRSATGRSRRFVQLLGCVVGRRACVDELVEVAVERRRAAGAS